VPNTNRPGDVLADRYRLVDLLNESGSGRFWRAHDRILQRHVAVHVIESDGERATVLLDAARASATVLDRRLLRVLDADRVDGICFVVNEWGSGSSLDVMLAKDGALGARRAAWIVSEVAAAIAAAHERDVAHGRLVPENVLVDGTGSVRVIGCCVDAALHGVSADPTRDVADLGGLLYCALTGKWPGPSSSRVTPAPTEHDRVLRPRRVRAGIPRSLDALCDTVLNPHAAHHGREAHDLATARGISDYLRAFVGDTAGMAEAEAAAQPPRGVETVVLPALRLPRPPEPLPAEPFHPSAPTLVGATMPGDDGDGDTGDTERTDETPTTDPGQRDDEVSAASPHPGPPAAAAGPVQAPTEAGLPIFDDATDDVTWLTARTTPAPPPPPFEPPQERPLFAPEPSDGQPARRARPGSTATGAGYWPWETDASGVHQTGTGTGTGVPAVPPVPASDEVPGRSWLRLALAIGLGLVLLVAIVVAYNLGRGRTPLGAEPDGSSSSTSASPSATPAAAAPVTGLVAADLDPQGDPSEENPELAPLAVDGNPATGWNTMTYNQNFGPGGLKTGVGLTLDLGESHDVSSVDVTVAGGATDVAIYVSDTEPSGVRGLRPAATATVSTHGRLTLDTPETGRYVVVWLTSLPFTEGGYRGEVSEVAVRG
jgi:hypothetical protein